MAIYDIERFSFAQMTSNGNGKTSASGTVGVFICLVGCVAFLLGALDRIFLSHSIDIMTQTIVFTGIGGALLGVKKWKSDGEDVPPVPHEGPPAPAPQCDPGEEPDEYYDKSPF
jgi:hypothetical protein